MDKGLWGARKVSGKLPNPWGLYDMYGNVMEWVQNYYTTDYSPYIREPNLHNGLNSPIEKEYPLLELLGEVLGEDCMMQAHLKVYDLQKDTHLPNGPVHFK